MTNKPIRKCQSLTCQAPSRTASVEAIFYGGKRGYFCDRHEKALERRLLDGSMVSLNHFIDELEGA